MASLPFFIMGFMSLVGGCLAICLPETATATLSNTLEEAEEFGKGQRFFYMPLIEQYGLRKRGNGPHELESDSRTASVDTLQTQLDY